jgi:ATP adenylyltransferase
MEYIEKHLTVEGCVFCNALAMSDGIENLIVFRSQHVFVILNRYPYTSGHLLIVPFEHIPTLEELDAETRAEMMEITTQGIRALRKAYNPEGFNIGMNIGEIAGAGIADHVHTHIVPRWAGDTPFMSTLGETRVLPEALEDTYERLKKVWAEVV